MAALTNNVEVRFDANHPPTLIQMTSAGTLTFFRGGLVHAGAGLAKVTPVATDLFVGVCWQKIVATATDLVTLAITGRFKFANTSFTNANYGLAFAQPAAALTDNPADLAVSTVGSAGAVGTLDQVTSTGVDGYLNIERRAAPENL